MRWTPQTVAVMVQVPEPAAYAMLGLGLLAVAALHGRRARFHG